MSGLINKAKEMITGHHEENQTGNSNTHGSHHESKHTGDSTIGTTGDADKYASGYGGKSANTTGNPMPIDKLTGHSSSKTSSSEYQDTSSGLGSDRIGDNASSRGIESSGLTGGSSNYDNTSSSGLGSGLTGSSTHHHHHESSGLTGSGLTGGQGLTGSSGLTGGSSNYESSGLTGSGMGSGLTGSSGLTGTSGYGEVSSTGHVAQEGTAEYERIRAEMAQHGHSGYGSGLQNSVQAAEFTGPGHHTHHTDHNFGGHSSGMTSGTGLTGHSSSNRDYDNTTSSSGGGLMDKVTGSHNSSDRTDRYDNNSSYDNTSSTGQHHQEGGLKGMMNKVMGKDDTTSETHGTHGSHVGTGASGQPRNTDY